MSTAGPNDHDLTQAWARWDLAADGVSLPPDHELRGPATDPGPTCPLKVLGEYDGHFHFFNPRGAYRVLSARQLGSKADLLGLLLGMTVWLWTCFPRFATRKIEGELRMVPIGYSVPAAAAWLMEQCARLPMFGPHIVFRRPGVWPGDDGEPVVHCGDGLLIKGVWRPAGMRTGDIIWPSDYPVARPSEPCDGHVGRDIQARIQEYWQFRHGGGAIMVLGAVASAMLGACPRWRPCLFIGGDSGGGKSYLLETLRAMCLMHFFTTDTTKAGLEANLAGRAMPSFVDEASDHADQRAAQTLLNLITASTGGEGGKVVRGTADGKGRSTLVIGAIVMASTAPPDLQPQHLARVALVELLAPQHGEDHRAEMEALIEHCRAQSSAIWGRMVSGYARYMQALAAFREALARIGCPPRQMDQHGAILAGHWTLCHEGVPDERQALDYVAAIRDFTLDAGEVADQSAGRLVAEHLASYRLRRDRSTEEAPTAELAALAWETRRDPESGEAMVASEMATSAQKDLGRHGMRAIRADETNDRFGRPPPQRGGPGDGLWIDYRSAPVTKIFEGTPWAGQRFRYPLRGLPGGRELAPGRYIKIGDRTVRKAIWISRADLLGEIDQ
jgi:hypothetical protein